MEQQGLVIAILDARSGISKQGNAWKTQEYVIETQDQYPKKICFEIYGEDKIQQANIQMGEHLNVSFDIDAREWNGRWFNSVRAWKVERVGNVQQQSAQSKPEQQQSAAPQEAPKDDNDGLPF